jgi:hypothetical protein
VTMGRPRKKREKPPLPSPEEVIRRLACEIVNPQYPEQYCPFWDPVTIQVLIKLLPGGVDEALVRVLGFRSATDRFVNEMSLTVLQEPKIALGILLLAEESLARYILHREMRIRWSS